MVGAWSGAVLIPTDDPEMEVLSRHREALAEFYRLPVPDAQAAATLLDKPKTYALAESLGIPCPRTQYVAPGDPPPEDLDEFRMPSLVKPTRNAGFWSHYGRLKAFTAQTTDEVRMFLKRTAEDGFEVMVQEMILGRDDQLHEYVAYWDTDSRPVSEFTYRKLRQNPPNLGVGRVGVSTKNRIIVEQARRLLQAARFVGLTETEFKYDARDGLYKLIEVNPRSTMQIQLPIDCGVDLPWVLYSDMVWGRKIRIPDWRAGVYWIHGGGELRVFAKHLREERWPLSDYIRPYLGPCSWAVFAPDDYGPLLLDTLGRVWYTLRDMWLNARHGERTNG